MELDLSLGDDELCVLDFARSNGLCSAYTDEPLLLHIPRGLGLYPDPWEPSVSDADVAAAAKALVREKLSVNQDSAVLLRSLFLLRDERVGLPEDAWKRMRGLKVELPVLRTDSELDLLWFGMRVEPVLTRRIPSEKVDVEKDEAFGWPSWYSNYAVKWDEVVRSEKLGVSRSVLQYLQETMRSPFTNDEFEKRRADSWKAHAKPVSTSRCLTPPLLPLSPPLTPYIPSSPVSRLPLVPESSGSVAAEARVLDDKIMAEDMLERTMSESSDPMLFEVANPPPFSPLRETQMMPILKRRAEDLKIEGPLTPPILSDSPSKKLKSVSFSTMLYEYILKEPWTGSHSDAELDWEDSFDDFFDDVEPFVKDLERKVENEQLIVADTTARPTIPDMDFSLPIAPWDEYSRKNGKRRSGETELSAQMVFLRHVKKRDLKAASKWPGLSSTERGLPWSIFTTHNPKISLEESLHGETEFGQIVASFTTGPIATSETQLWKKEGLRILDAEDDEAELEMVEVQECQGVGGLVRKRKLEMDGEDVEHLVKRKEAPGPLPAIMHGGSVLQKSASQHKPAQESNESGPELMFGSPATTALQKFMETRGMKIETTTPGERNVNSATPAATALAQKLPVHPGAEPQISNDMELQIPHPVPKPPSILRNAQPCSFVVSLKLMQRSSLIRKVEQLYTDAELVYRDYNIPHLAAQHEADIILSPSTGLIFTYLQHLKQRALPGQPDRSPLKERMRSLDLRYERLIVMTSQGLRGDIEEQERSRPEDPGDKEALSLFEGFAAKLKGEVIVKYIAGGEQALAHSIAVEMIHYGLPHGSEDIGDIKPLAAESNWELFLRRVGFNPFAAQAILTSLKLPHDTLISQSYSHLFSPARAQIAPVSGLPVFLLMSADERINRFQVLMGGSRILHKINAALEREWISAAHGFRV